MIRGAVDYISPEAIGGWIYSDIASVKNRVVLAFHGDQCIGSGQIELYREDLAKAGLGDGYLGFNFSIGLAEEVNPAEVFVKLSDSDFILKQASASIAGGAGSLQTRRNVTSGVHRNAAWMRERGWIRQDECDFLTRLDTLGVYGRILARTELTSADGTLELSPAAVVKELFEVFLQAHVELAVGTFDSVSEALASATSANESGPSGKRDIAALWTPGSTTISAQEASHLEPLAPGEAFVGIDYPVSSTRILLIDTQVVLKPKLPAPAGGIKVYRARLTQ